MLGIQFDTCNSFGISFSFHNCTLNHAIFYGTKIKSTKFINCQLHGIDFTDCDLANAHFSNCDLLNSTFSNTNLEKADLSTSIDFSIDPEKNKLKKAKFSVSGLVGLVAKYNIDIV
jgi:uncharacterized protein YjbI with pentapeptide repeats